MEGRRSVLKVVTQAFPKKTEVSRCKEAGSFLADNSHGNFLLTTERMFATLGFQPQGPLFLGFRKPVVGKSFGAPRFFEKGFSRFPSCKKATP